MLHSRSGELEESPKNHLSDVARAEKEVAQRLREHRELVKKITRRLYTTKRNSTEVAEHREVQSKVLNLRQITRQAKAARSQSSLSSIHNLSLSMIEDIKGARVRRLSGPQEELISPLPMQPTLQLPPRKSESSTQQMKLLTAKMSQILQVNSSKLLEAKHPVLMQKTCPLKFLRERHHEAFPRVPAETVRAQLTRDIKRVETKLRLLVSSLLLLEEEIKQCTSECMREKKRLLQKRANSLYTLMDFLKDTRERASQYIRQIDFALSAQDVCGVTKFRHEEDNGEWLSHLGEAVTVMAAHGRAIDFVASQVEVRRRAEITKKELVKYEQVTFSAVVPKIMGRHSGSSL